MTRRLVWLLFLLGAGACTEEATAPGRCPNFCPGGRAVTTDTIFTDLIERDSSYRGYLPPYAAEALAVADLPSVQSRAFFVLPHNVPPTVVTSSSDTTQVPIVVDSSQFRLTILRRDSSATNLTLRVYALPISADSNSTFADLDPDFNARLAELCRSQQKKIDEREIWVDSVEGNVLRVGSRDYAVAGYALEVEVDRNGNLKLLKYDEQRIEH